MQPSSLKKVVLQCRSPAGSRTDSGGERFVEGFLPVEAAWRGHEPSGSPLPSVEARPPSDQRERPKQKVAPPPTALEAEPLHLLTPAGQDLEIARADLLAIYFVRDFPGRALPSLSGVRAGARLPGLWVRVRGKGARWDGVLASDLLDLEHGVWLTPLRAGSNSQRLYIPRRVVETLEAVEVARPARRRHPRSGAAAGGVAQFELFHDMSEDNA